VVRGAIASRTDVRLRLLRSRGFPLRPDKRTREEEAKTLCAFRGSAELLRQVLSFRCRSFGGWRLGDRRFGDGALLLQPEQRLPQPVLPQQEDGRSRWRAKLALFGGLVDDDAKSRPAALMTVTRRCAGDWMRKSSFEKSSCLPGRVRAP